MIGLDASLQSASTTRITVPDSPAQATPTESKSFRISASTVAGLDAPDSSTTEKGQVDDEVNQKYFIKLAGQLMAGFNISHEHIEDIASCVKIGWFEGGQRCTDAAYLYRCCRYKVIDWIRHEIRWMKIGSLDTPLHDLTDTTMGDLLCSSFPNPEQIMRAKQEAVIESDLSTALAEYEAKPKPFGMTQLKGL